MNFSQRIYHRLKLLPILSIILGLDLTQLIMQGGTLTGILGPALEEYIEEYRQYYFYTAGS